jgi:hypothetical protein
VDAKMPDLWKSDAASYPNDADEMRLWFRVVAPDVEFDQEVDPELDLFCHQYRSSKACRRSPGIPCRRRSSTKIDIQSKKRAAWPEQIGR